MLDLLSQHTIDGLENEVVLDQLVDVVEFFLVQVLVVAHLFQKLVRLKRYHNLGQRLLGSLHKLSHYAIKLLTLELH